MYNIVFDIKLAVVFFLVALLCILMRSGYVMTDTTLYNARLNVKPIFNVYLDIQK